MWTPLPPEPTGIADYAFDLLSALADRAEIVAVVGDEAVSRVSSPPGVRVVGAGAWLDHDSATADVDVYQIGNNIIHGWIQDRAVVSPGLVVYHDASLLDFYATRFFGKPGFAEEALWNEGLSLGFPPSPVTGQPRGLPTVRADGVHQPDRLAVLFSRRTVETSLATIVHSEWLAGELRRRHPATPIHLVYHGAAIRDDPATAIRARSELGWDTSHFVFGVFGGITGFKRVPTVLTAFAALRQLHPLARMVVAGRADDSSVVDRVVGAVAAGGLEDDVQVLLDPPKERFDAVIGASDAVVNLRWPTTGETSGVMMRAFGAGRPVITSALPQHRELPSSFCWQVPVDEVGEGRGLYEQMSAAVRDRERCRTAGLAARAFVEASASWEAAADRYVEIAGEAVAKRGSRPVVS
jgi:glycosyltransferase involved in cell wall biosynthesis